MISPCCGCSKVFYHSLQTINAKEWKPDVCKVAVDKSYHCSNARCDFSIEGECCTEFQFCDTCLDNHELIDKKFAEYVIDNKLYLERLNKPRGTLTTFRA